jgi:hypothetical protein
MKAYVLLILLFTTTFLISCIKENIEESVTNSVVYPEYSLPLGTFTTLIDTSFSEPGYNITNADTVPVMFNGLIYYSSLYAYSESYEKLNINYTSSIRSHIISLTFRVIVTNNCPSDIVTQVYFVDSAYQVNDSVFSDGPHTTLKAAANSNGVVTKATTSTTEVTFEGDRLDSLLNCNLFKITNKIYYYNSASSYLIFSSGNKVEVIAGARIKLKFSGNEI